MDLAQEVPVDDSYFVSMRVGDQQKLSKLSQSRAFRFPKAGNRHYGKIEVYQRVGSTYVDVDPANTFEREVSINAGPSGKLTFKVGVDGGADASASASANASRPPTALIETEPGEIDAKSQAAREYLSQHGLETRLAEAMQALLREKPDNPTAWLGSMLLSSVHPDELRMSSSMRLRSPKSPKSPKSGSRRRAGSPSRRSDKHAAPEEDPFPPPPAAKAKNTVLTTNALYGSAACLTSGMPFAPRVL